MGIRETIQGVTDEHRASEIGRLFIVGSIARKEYDAGIAYATTILDYLKTIDAPSPYGDELSNIPDSVCLYRKIEMARAREILNRAGKKAASVVDRVTVYGERVAPEELPLLCAGLTALSGK